MSQFDPHKHHRRSIRLKDWDYRSAGYYFVTICTHQRENLFETAVFQAIAAHAIERIPNQKHTAHVELDEWIVMPNHIHVSSATSANGVPLNNTSRTTPPAGPKTAKTSTPSSPK
jgi:putative transposase